MTLDSQTPKSQMVRMGMHYRYTESSKRLHVYGTNGLQDIQEIKKLIENGEIPVDIRTLFYQRNQDSVVGMIFRGKYLDNLLKKNPDADQEKPKPNFKSILKTVNDANTCQSSYAGILIFSRNAKRFLFVNPKNTKTYGLLGDHLAEGEEPVQTVCRVAGECKIELTPDCLVTLCPIEIDGTTFHNFLVLSNPEFKIPVMDRFIAATWRSYDAMEELTFHPAVTQLFEKDKKIQRLIAPIEVDFDSLIDEILHSE